jgi:aminoglycoside phosphotransferase (APT) family kinase protein
VRPSILLPMEDVPGIAWESVSRFFAKHVSEGDAHLSFELIAGGRSNLTYLVSGGDRQWVLRRPPLGHVLPTAHDMAREYRVLSALADTEVPVPGTYAICQDESVNGAPFYVMEYTPGVVLHEGLPPGFATTHDERRRIGRAMVKTLVGLHAVDYAAVGLADFGRPEGYVERQVRRWSEQWERSKTRELPIIDELIRILRAKIPVSCAPTIVHGDFRLGNMALSPEQPDRVLAIFDWEMATLGDPLADLGYTLIYWGEEGDPPGALGDGRNQAVSAQPGFMTRAELVAEYAERSGREVSAIAFYEALAFYKLAVISEGIYARFLKGKTVGEGFGDAGGTALRLVERGLEQARKL